MKSLKDYSLKISEQEYHNNPAWSYSVIAKYAKDGFSSISTLHDRTEPTPSMQFGSLLDSMLTKGKATLDEYVVSDTVVPDSVKTVLDKLASLTSEPFCSITSQFMEEVMDYCKFQMNWKYQTRFEKVASYCDYYENLISGKTVVSTEDWNDAKEMYNVIRNDEYLKTIFGTKNTDDIEYLYQTKYVVDYTLDDGNTVKVKFMPDLLKVNHKEKTIQPDDFKTSAMPAYNFKENFLKYHYYLQAELYTDILRYFIQNVATEYKDYTILPYLFTDISRVDKVPVTYVYDPSNGFSFTKNDRTYSYKGWQELLKEIISYEESQAKVPVGIVTDGPNDLMEILNRG